MVSKVNVRIVLIVAIFVMIGGIVFYISRGGSRQPLQEPVAKNLTQNTDIALLNAHFSEIRNGQVEWELTADKADYDKTGEVVFLTGIRMNFLQKTTVGTITVTALNGEYSTKTKDVKLRGNVLMVTSDNAKFTTDAIDYKASESKFITTSQVQLEQERLTLKATGMEMKVRDHRAVFKRMVEAVVADNKIVPKATRQD